MELVGGLVLELVGSDVSVIIIVVVGLDAGVVCVSSWTKLLDNRNVRCTS